jgi:DnaJ-class molecular chaperone
LYVIVTVAAHRIFNRRGDDLNTKIDLPLPDAVLGGEVQVPTIKGTTVSLKVPPETQNGRVFRLKGQGMPQLRSVAGGASEQLGDLLVTMDVKVPTALNDEERALFARLRELRSL